MALNLPAERPAALVQVKRVEPQSLLKLDGDFSRRDSLLCNLLVTRSCWRRLTVCSSQAVNKAHRLFKQSHSCEVTVLH